MGIVDRERERGLMYGGDSVRVCAPERERERERERESKSLYVEPCSHEAQTLSSFLV